MSKFIAKAIEVAPFMTFESVGDPDPNKRSARVVLSFIGADAIDKAQALHEAIISDVTRSRHKRG